MNPIAQGELVASALLVFEIIGVLAFAASGLIEAARKKFDIFGVVLIAFIAAFGGGTLRDILLDRRPFFWVENQELPWQLSASPRPPSFSCASPPSTSSGSCPPGGSSSKPREMLPFVVGGFR